MNEQQVKDIIGAYVGPSVTTAILQHAVRVARVDVRRLSPADSSRLLHALEYPLKNMLRDPARRDACLRRLRDLLTEQKPAAVTGPRRRVIRILGETDIVVARGAGREMCQLIGFRAVIQLKVATAISEMARNIIQYAGQGTVELKSLDSGRAGIEVNARDKGPGITNLDEVMSGSYRSRTGMGLGIKGVKNLMDEFEIRTAAGEGTEVIARKFLT